MYSENIDLSCFHARLDDLIKTAGFNRRSLSLELGEGERYLNGVFANRSYPKLPVLIKISHILGLSLDDLVGIGGHMAVKGTDIDDIAGKQAEQLLTQITERVRRKLIARGAKPSTDDVLDWWWQNGGLLSGFENFENVMDIYTAPSKEDTIPNPTHLGADSLAAQSFDIKTSHQLTKILRDLPKPYLKSLVLSQADAAIGKPTITYPKISVSLPKSTTAVNFTYKRLLLPVRDISGKEYVINYSQPIRKSAV